MNSKIAVAGMAAAAVAGYFVGELVQYKKTVRVIDKLKANIPVFVEEAFSNIGKKYVMVETDEGGTVLNAFVPDRLDADHVLNMMGRHVRNPHLSVTDGGFTVWCNCRESDAELIKESLADVDGLVWL